MSSNKNIPIKGLCESQQSGTASQPGQDWRNCRRLRAFVEAQFAKDLPSFMLSLNSEQIVDDPMHLSFIVCEWKNHVVQAMKNQPFDPDLFMYHAIKFWLEHKGCQSLRINLVLIKLFEASKTLSNHWTDIDQLKQFFLRPERVSFRITAMKTRGVDEEQCKSFFSWLLKEN